MSDTNPATTAPKLGAIPATERVFTASQVAALLGMDTTTLETALATLRELDANLLHKTGDETAEGVKTFADGVITPTVTGSGTSASGGVNELVLRGGQPNVHEVYRGEVSYTTRVLTIMDIKDALGGHGQSFSVYDLAFGAFAGAQLNAVAGGKQKEVEAYLIDIQAQVDAATALLQNATGTSGGSDVAKELGDKIKFLSDMVNDLKAIVDALGGDGTGSIVATPLTCSTLADCDTFIDTVKKLEDEISQKVSGADLESLSDAVESLTKQTDVLASAVTNLGSKVDDMLETIGELVVNELTASALEREDAPDGSLARRLQDFVNDPASDKNAVAKIKAAQDKAADPESKLSDKVAAAANDAVALHEAEVNAAIDAVAAAVNNAATGAVDSTGEALGAVASAATGAGGSDPGATAAQSAAEAAAKAISFVKISHNG